jgi:integrase
MRSVGRLLASIAWRLVTTSRRSVSIYENCVVGLGWVNFQVLRRSCSSLMNDEGIDPKVISDQLGHTLDVGLNVYTRVALERQLEAVNKLDSRLQ